MKQLLDTEKGRRKQAAGNAGQPARTREGQADGKKLPLPGGRFTPASSTGSPSPARVVQGFLCASLAAQRDLEQGWATQPVTFKQP